MIATRTSLLPHLSAVEDGDGNLGDLVRLVRHGLPVLQALHATVGVLGALLVGRGGNGKGRERKKVVAPPHPFLTTTTTTIIIAINTNNKKKKSNSSNNQCLHENRCRRCCDAWHPWRSFRNGRGKQDRFRVPFLSFPSSARWTEEEIDHGLARAWDCRIQMADHKSQETHTPDASGESFVSFADALPTAK